METVASAAYISHLRSRTTIVPSVSVPHLGVKDPPCCVDVPETHFAHAPDGRHVAYQVVGSGPIDVLVTRPTAFGRPSPVHIGQRVSAQAGPGEVFISPTVADLVAGSGIERHDEGERRLKGVPGAWQLYRVASG
jgi:hypothetical protein